MNKIIMWILIILGVLAIASASFVGIKIHKAKHMIDEKPVIYLYPEQDMNINVQLNVNGEIIKDEPKYNQRWNVFVTKDGLIDNKYDYLFYEADLNKIDLPNEAWIVDYNNLEQWFDKNLKLLGLNEKEKLEFMDYWLNRLPKANYYEIKLLSQEFLKENMDLIINPKPDTIIRLNFYFTPLDEKHEISSPKIKTPKRDGFTVVEGGGILND